VDFSALDDDDALYGNLDRSHANPESKSLQTAYTQIAQEQRLVAALLYILAHELGLMGFPSGQSSPSRLNEFKWS